jgi:hypothetical protein
LGLRVCKVAKVQPDLQVPKVCKAFKELKVRLVLLDRKVSKERKAQRAVQVHKVL